MCRVKEEEEERLEEEGGSVNHSGVCVCVSVCVSECGSEVFLSTAEGKNVNSLTRPILFITITIIIIIIIFAAAVSHQWGQESWVKMFTPTHPPVPSTSGLNFSHRR